MTTRSVILSAPQGCGKTTLASELRLYFDCLSVVDEWDPSQPITEGALHLTNVPFTEIPNLPGVGVVVFHGESFAALKKHLAKRQ